MEKDSVSIKKQESLNNRISVIKKEISNLLMLAAKVASESLAQKLEELESEKNIIQEQLEQVCYEVNTNKISVEKFSKIFKEAYNYLREGSLSSTKSLVEIFVDRVFVYEDHINILFRYHQDLNLQTSALS